MRRLSAITALSTALLVTGTLAGCPGIGPFPWFRHFGDSGDDIAYAAGRTTDGGFILAGTTEVSAEEDNDVLLTKISRDGAELWQTRFGDDRDDAAMGVKQTADGGYVLAGRFGGEGDPTSDGFLLKTDDAGAEEWRTIIDSGGEDYAVSVVNVLSSGHLVAAQLDILGDTEGVMILFDNAGTELWRVTGGEASHAIGAVPVTDGGYVFAAWRLIPADLLEDYASEIILVKTDEDGNTTWTQMVPFDRAVEARDIRPTADGGFVIAGQDEALASDSAIGVFKFDADGALTWEHIFAREGRETAAAIDVAPDGGYIVCGTSSSFQSIADGFLLKLSPAGTAEWFRGYGNDDSDEFFDVLALLDGGYLAVGSSTSYAADDDVASYEVYVVRTGPNGRIPRAETQPFQP